MASDGKLAAAGMLAAGMAVGGWFIGHGFMQGRATDRYVTVKGVAEREVEADVALWPLRFVATNDDLAKAQAEIARSTAGIFDFLSRHGIDEDQAELRGLEVTDVLANPYGERSSASRYIIASTVMVRSHDPAEVFAATQKVSELVDAGVVLSSENAYAGGGPTYLFTRLNDVKPEMIAEATAAARQAAEQFANDSGSRLGTIRNANQGVFVILPRDQSPGAQEQQQLEKIVRVVSTVEYFLDD